ncbi:acetylcholinesterase precursor [Amniculicola lignicola CBS 123094]|uniref:Carboxylic ester hydrolase n=1 Tax=Amniculicola lignicola CBS 123094 TaxID=1392246 RepID=A0A6A5X5C8_9PLEO|nr:acetylcholinesterase precursor [Amniculicola lignicola CBS 123094]
MSFAKLLGAAAFFGAVYAADSSLPTVDLGYEIYRAANFNSTGGFYNFSNIRYAAPPIGNLRFAAPASPAKNRTAINTGSTGRICPQAQPYWGSEAVTFLTELILGTPSNVTEAYTPPGATSNSPVPAMDPRTSEDCLFLDVYVPDKILKNAKKKQSAPVLLWIYGGGYVNGQKNTNPAGLLAASGSAKQGDVIYVSINYRLGALGFVSGSSYQAEGGAANLGLLDQQFALQWVKRYIGTFGGDAKKVTVFGESAGGGSIMHQITAYGGMKGPVPFQQAVPQSPGWLPMSSALQQEEHYQKFLNLTGTKSLAELRNLSSEAIIKANFQQVTYDSPYGTYTYGPTVDGLFVPAQPGQLLAQGRFDKSVKVMVGHNSNEGTYFTPPNINSTADIERQLIQAFPYMPAPSLDYLVNVLYPPVFNGSYPYLTNYQRASLIIAEGVFTCNTYYLDTALNNKTYSYLFAVPPAFHGFDVAYTYWDGGAVSAVNPLLVRNATVARALQDFITSFAETGVPQAKGIVKFDMYGKNATVLELDIDNIGETRDSNANVRCKWWQKALYS